MSDRPKLTGSAAPRLQAPPRGGLHDRGALNRILIGLAVLCVLLVAADPLLEKHPYFQMEYQLGFYAIVGAAAAAVAILVALLLRLVVKRPEDPHDR